MSKKDWNLKYRFAREVLIPVATRLSHSRPLKYQEIVELDEIVRNFKAGSMEASAKEDGVDARMLLTEVRIYEMSRHIGQYWLIPVH